MKKKWLLIVVYTFFGMAPAFGESDRVVVTNIGFEEGSTSGWGVEGNRSNFIFTPDSVRPHTGKYSARFSLTAPSDGGRRRYIAFALPGDRAYSKGTISFFMKSEAIPDNAVTVFGLERSAKGVIGWLTGRRPMATLPASTDWKQLRVNVDFSPAASVVILYFEIENKGLSAGSFWLDDIVIEGVPELPRATIRSDAAGNIFTADSGSVSIALPSAAGIAGAHVLVKDEIGRTVRDMTIAPGQPNTMVDLRTRGYYSLEAVTEYRSGLMVTNLASAAVIGAPIPDEMRLNSPLGFFNVHASSNFSINAGGAWNRNFLGMQRIERTNSGFSGAVNLMLPTNEKLIVCLWAPPAWIMEVPQGVVLTPSSYKVYPPKNWDEFGSMMRYLIDRPRTLRYLEVINEPDANWKGSHEDLVRYHAVVAQAVKSVDPSIKVLGPAFCSIQISLLDRLVKLGLFDHLDGLTIHAYVNGTEPEGEFIANVVALKKYLASIGKKDFPVYFTEFGWTTGEGTWQKPVDELTQAQYVVRALSLLSAEHIDGLNYFCMLYQTPNNGEHHFSLLRKDTTPKPAYAAHAAYARHSAGTIASSRHLLSPTTHLVLMKKHDRAAAVLWDIRSNSFDLPQSALCSDMMGRPIALQTGVPIGPSPIYFEVPDEKFAEPVIREPISIVTGKKIKLPLNHVLGVASLSVENGEIATTLETVPGRYTLIGKNGSSWEMQPIDILSPLSASACSLIWPANEATPTLTMSVTSYFPTPVATRSRVAFDTAHDLFTDAVTLASNESREMKLPLNTLDPGRRYTGRFIAETKVGENYHHGDSSFDIAIVSAVSARFDENESLLPLFDISGYDPFILGDSVKPFAPDDCQARIAFTVSDQGLRFYAVVTDDVHRQEKSASGIWAEDCIQIAFDVDRDERWRPNSGKYLNGHRVFEYGLAKGAGDEIVWRWISYSDLPGECGEPRVKARIVRDGTTTRYDALFPWQTLGLSERPKAGRTFGVSVAVNDIDGQGSKRHGLRLFRGIVEGKDPLRFGTLFIR